MTKTILVIGSGAREHAIIYTLLRSKHIGKIYSSTSNAGINQISINADINLDNFEEIANFCHEKSIDLVVIGPEQPLIEGIVDYLQSRGIKTFGPSKEASKLEGSKIFMKELCMKCNIPTAKYNSFSNKNDAIKFLDEVNPPFVIKADGIAAGKGVIISQDKNEAINSIEEIFDGKFGSAGDKIIIEEFLEGEEVSFFAICDGKIVKFIGTAGDHKKAYDNDKGPNTGGMGAYSPSPFIDDDLHEDIMTKMINPVIDYMSKNNAPFLGILFAGIILTKDGPKLLEFNVRFGDPEAQVILPRLKTDFLDIIMKSESGNLNDIDIEFSDRKSVCVVISSKGYPNLYKKGSEIKNLDKIKDSIIFHAGTKEEDGKILSNGGRVLSIVSIDDDFKNAIDKSYKSIDLMNWEGGFYRKDIAKKLL